MKVEIDNEIDEYTPTSILVLRFLGSLMLILLALFFIYSCGTGPWIVRKNIYKTYKEPLYKKNNYKFKTDCYYLQIGELTQRNNFRKLLVFFKDGYITSIRLSDKNLENELDKLKKTSIIDVGLDWWRIKEDSIIIEHYVEQKIEMMTWNSFEKGRFLNDSIIELQYEDSHFKPKQYLFIKSDSLPVFVNTGRYLKKEWYWENLHESRK